jgi:peroxiredoxin
LETGLIVSSVLLWVVVLLNLLLTLALVRRFNALPRPAPPMGLKAGETAPDFTAQTLSGETVTRATYAGSQVGFVFLSTHCGPCRELLPRFEPLGAKAAQAGVNLLLVIDDELEATRAFAEQYHITLPVLIAPRETNSLMNDYQARSTPSYCLVNAQGKVQSSGYPNFDGEAWKDWLDSWAKQSVPVA